MKLIINMQMLNEYSESSGKILFKGDINLIIFKVDKWASCKGEIENY